MSAIQSVTMNRLPFFRLTQLAVPLLLAPPLIAAAAPGRSNEPAKPAAADSSPSGKRGSPPRADTSVGSADGLRVDWTKVEINTADVRTLAGIPAIGPQLARAIVAARPFATLEDLNRLQGISPERLEQIRKEVMIDARTPESLAPDRVGPEDGKVDVNSADLETLADIPSIGPELAEALVALRPFATVEEFSRLRNISAERLEQLRTVLTIRTMPAETPTKGDAKKFQPIERPAPAANRDQPARRN
jgi:DNA uptake protein ComE-like DNA-binding protein